MVISHAVSDVAIFEGPKTIEIARMRHNEKSGLLEYKHTGIFSPWHQLAETAIPMFRVGREKYLVENGVETKVRGVVIKQSIRGEQCEDSVNPRMASTIESLQMESTRLHRLSRFYYDTLIGMAGKDRFAELMKEYFKNVKDTKVAGSTFNEYDSGGFGGYPSRLGMVRPPV